MKRILILTLTVLLTILLTACGNTPEQFTVTMHEAYLQHDPITVTVTLPTNAKESEITFSIDSRVYSVTSIPTVDDPTFVFEDIPDDGMMKIYLAMPSNESETAILYMIPENETTEMCFVAAEGDFTRLTDYLGSN